MPSEPTRPGLRERQRQETHLLIRRTAVELTLQKGAAAVSVKTICEAAGVSARTFFNHFPSKDEALIPDFPPFGAEAEQAFLQGDEPDLVSGLEQLLRSYVIGLQDAEGEHPVGPLAMKRLLEANPVLLPRLLAIFERFERLIAELVARRTGRRSDELFCVVAALTATVTLRAAYSTLTHGPAAGDLDRSDRTAVNQHVTASIGDAFAVLRELADPARSHLSPM
jgi:AcrR family transcriptional regulator